MVSWLSTELSKLECVSLTTLLDPRDSWVIVDDDDDKQPLTPTCNILLMLITVDSKSISKRVCSKHKRTRTTVKNLSVEDCFLIMDHVEKDKFSDINENFYEVLSKSGLTATIDPTTNSLFKIKFLQLADMMGVLDEDDSNVHVLTKDNDNHLIQIVDSCPQCLSSNMLNNTVHMCREIPHSNGATTIIASSSFEREFDMESFHKRVVSCTNLMLPIGNDKYFFYSLTQQQNMMGESSKSMNTLRTESLTALSNMLDDCKHKRDDFRPASETFKQASYACVCLDLKTH